MQALPSGPKPTITVTTFLVVLYSYIWVVLLCSRGGLLLIITVVLILSPVIASRLQPAQTVSASNQGWLTPLSDRLGLHRSFDCYL